MERRRVVSIALGLALMPVVFMASAAPASAQANADAGSAVPADAAIRFDGVDLRDAIAQLAAQLPDITSVGMQAGLAGVVHASLDGVAPAQAIELIVAAHGGTLVSAPDAADPARTVRMALAQRLDTANFPGTRRDIWPDPAASDATSGRARFNTQPMSRVLRELAREHGVNYIVNDAGAWPVTMYLQDVEVGVALEVAAFFAGMEVSRVANPADRAKPIYVFRHDPNAPKSKYAPADFGKLSDTVLIARFVRESMREFLRLIATDFRVNLAIHPAVSGYVDANFENVTLGHMLQIVATTNRLAVHETAGGGNGDMPLYLVLPWSHATGGHVEDDGDDGNGDDGGEDAE